MIARTLDFFISIIALMILAPLFLLIALVLKFTGEGEIFFFQERVGLYGKKFRLVKFATMLKNSPETGVITVKGDSRVLPVGRILRKSKINELPQLLNILLGDMSFVGPRPQTERCFFAFPPKVREVLMRVKPGLSGVGSIVFRDEEAILLGKNNLTDFYDEILAPYKGELEIWFSSNYSIKLYISIIIITIIVILQPKSRLIWHVFPTLPKPPPELVELFK